MKLEYVIQNWSATEILIGWFVGFIIHQEFNISYIIKRFFKIRVTKRIKLIDCYPCFTFWVALVVTLSPVSAIGAYLIAILIDKKQ